jgi:hypothetical protein
MDIAQCTRRCLMRLPMAVMLLLAMGSGSCVWAQSGNKAIETVYVIGTSRIQGDDMSASREQAIADGLVTAVSRVLFDLLPQETVVGNFQLLSERVIEKTDTFVRNYKVLTESTHGGLHRVMVKASVSVRRLKGDLKKIGIHTGQRPYPRVLFCMAEKLFGDLSFTYWWGGDSAWRTGISETRMRQILKDKGFILVAPRANAASGSLPPELSVPEAVSLAQQLKAEIVVLGQAEAQEAPNTMAGTIRSFKGTIAARAYRVDSGEQIAQTQRSALTASEEPNAGSREALRNAADLSGEDLVLQIAEAWFSHQSGLSQTKLIVEGIGGKIASFVKFRGTLGTMSGVDNLQLKEMMPDAAVLLVDYQGTARALADALLLQNFDTFGLNITAIEADSIRLQLVAQ